MNKDARLIAVALTEIEWSIVLDALETQRDAQRDFERDFPELQDEATAQSQQATAQAIERVITEMTKNQPFETELDNLSHCLNRVVTQVATAFGLEEGDSGRSGFDDTWVYSKDQSEALSISINVMYNDEEGGWGC